MIVGAIFNQLPTVSTLPTIAGFDVDTTLSIGMGTFNTYTTAFWPLADLFAGFLVISAYYGIKMLARLLMGHRAPGLH